MSEVKPTLIYLEEIDEQTPPLNSWLSTFPTGKWIDVKNINWFWIIINAVNVPSSYEYRIRFDNLVEDITLIFPFVVKTLDNGVKKVFIDGIEYQARSKENYGDRFLVSGQEFKFKVATKYKLSRQAVPILRLEYKQATFKSVEFLNLSYIRLKYTPSNFITVNKVETNYIATRNISPTFIIPILISCSYIKARIISNTFNNVNIFSVPVIANCRNTSWERFGGIWGSCETWTSLT
jgi:hypothetical protein